MAGTEGPLILREGGYTYVKSPVDWLAIDVLAVLTVLWILGTLWYKGVKQANLMRYPQIEALITYPEWDQKLLRNKPSIGAKAIPLFFKVLFYDVLAMNILKCERGKSAAEVVHTRGAKRTAKLMMVWGFVFAGISTTLAFLTFEPNYIVLDLTHPARIFGMLGGVLIIVGSLLWLSVRYKEANYRGVWDLIGADYLPVIIFLIGVSGFALQAAIYLYGMELMNNGEVSPATWAFFVASTHFHAIPIAMFFILFFWTKANHIVYRIFWRIYEYADKDFAGKNTRLPPSDLHPLNKTGKQIQPGY
ncbi:MAG: hypothetical protein QXR18_10470 [Pyrobaculum sp.]